MSEFVRIRGASLQENVWFSEACNEEGLAITLGLSKSSRACCLLAGKGIAISAAVLAAFEAMQRRPGIDHRVECFHHCLTACSDPSPVADEGRTTEQRGLNAQTVEAPHVPGRIDATKMNLVGVERLHATSLFDTASVVQ